MLIVHEGSFKTSQVSYVPHPVNGDEAVRDDVGEERGDEDGDPLVGDVVAVRLGGLGRKMFVSIKFCLTKLYCCNASFNEKQMCLHTTMRFNLGKGMGGAA